MKRQKQSGMQPLTKVQMKKLLGGAAPAKYLCADRINHVFKCFTLKSQCLAGCPTPSLCTLSPVACS